MKRSTVQNWTREKIDFMTSTSIYAAITNMTSIWRREPWNEIVILSHTFEWEGIRWE